MQMLLQSTCCLGAAQDLIAQQQLGINNPTVAEGNTLVSTVMAATTAALRFPGALCQLWQISHPYRLQSFIDKTRGSIICQEWHR